MKTNGFVLIFSAIAILGGIAYVSSAKPRHELLAPLALGEQSPETAVLAAYKQLEKAVQTGDGNLYLSLQSQRKLNEASNKAAYEQFRKGFPADPSVRYEVLGVRVKSDHAAVLGKITGSVTPQFYLATFVLENGSWKIAEDETNEQPIDVSALEAAVPPKDGAFTRSGSPWDKVAYAATNTKWFKENEIVWRMQAAKDESFLYIRFTAKDPLPAPGTEIATDAAKSFKEIPSAPDVMIIKAGPTEFELQVSDNPMTRATFDESSHATSNRYFMEYSFTVRNPERETLFSDGTSHSFDPLVVVQDQFIDIRLPLKALGAGTASAEIQIREANSLGKILPYTVNSLAL